MIKKIVITLALALLTASLCLVGCGGESNQDQAFETEAMDLLMQSSQAMSDLSSYRMSGSMIMDAADGTMTEMGLPMTIDFQSDINIEGGEFNQHMVMTTKSEAMGEYKTESYIIAGQFYQYDPARGWLRMDASQYTIQNLNTGLVDAQRLEVMADIAQNTRIIEERDEMIGISFHLDEEYMKTVLDSAKEYMQQLEQGLSEDWLKSMEEIAAGFQSDVSMWVWRDSKLVDHMEMRSLIGGMGTMQNIEMDMRINMYDYNQEIEVVLHEEAKGAKEYPMPSM